MKPITGIAVCPRAAIGHATAAPPKSVMNSRRCMSSPKRRRRIVSAQTSTLIGAETGIKTITAVHSQCRRWVQAVSKLIHRRNVENTIPQHGIQPYVRSIISSHIAQFLKNASTRAADVEVFTQPGSCVDHFIVLGEADLRRILRAYAGYYNDTHRSLDKDAPVSRPVQWTGIINSHAILGGLHHHYVRV